MHTEFRSNRSWFRQIRTKESLFVSGFVTELMWILTFFMTFSDEARFFYLVTWTVGTVFSGAHHRQKMFNNPQTIMYLHNNKDHGDSKGQSVSAWWTILYGAFRSVSVNAVDIWSKPLNVVDIRTTKPKWLKLSELNCYHLTLMCVKYKPNPFTFV